MENGEISDLADAPEQVELLRRANTSLTLRLKAAEHRSISMARALARQFALEMAELRDPAARAALESARLRAVAIEQLHCVLSRMEEPGEADMRALLSDLCDALCTALDARGRNVIVRTQVSSPPLPTQMAATLSLIVNELVGNALRYAFRGRPRGRIDVTLRTAGGRIVVTVEDDGIGISDKTLGRGDTGLSLVRHLTEELRGIVEVSRQGGTGFMILIPFDGGG